MGKILARNAVAFAAAVNALPEGTALTIEDGELTVITDDRSGKDEPYPLFSLMADAALLGKKEAAESVLTALRNLRRAVEEAGLRHSSATLTLAFDQATIVLGRGY